MRNRFQNGLTTHCSWPVGAQQLSWTQRTLEHHCEFAVPRGGLGMRKGNEPDRKVESFAPGEPGRDGIRQGDVAATVSSDPEKVGVGNGDIRNSLGKLNDPGKPPLRRLGILPRQLRMSPLFAPAGRCLHPVSSPTAFVRSFAPLSRPPASVFIPAADEVALGIAQCIRVSWILSIQERTSASTSEAISQAR